MLKFAANLSFLFATVPFFERFELAKQAGFQGCEFLFPYDYYVDEISLWRQNASIKQVLFNAPPGNWSAGERGFGALVGRQDEFRRSIQDVLSYAQALECKNIHVMAGRTGQGEVSNRDVFCENLRFACSKCADAGLTVLIEPINPVDMPGYALTDPDVAMQIIEDVARPNLKLQYDCYHAAMLGRNIEKDLHRFKAALGHIQIAGFPDRNEPNSGTLDYSPIFKCLNDIEYNGWVGCEYHPLRKGSPDFSWREAVFQKS